MLYLLYFFVMLAVLWVFIFVPRGVVRTVSWLKWAERVGAGQKRLENGKLHKPTAIKFFFTMLPEMMFDNNTYHSSGAHWTSPTDWSAP